MKRCASCSIKTNRAVTVLIRRKGRRSMQTFHLAQRELLLVLCWTNFLSKFLFAAQH